MSIFSRTKGDSASRRLDEEPSAALFNNDSEPTENTPLLGETNDEDDEVEEEEFFHETRPSNSLERGISNPYNKRLHRTPYQKIAYELALTNVAALVEQIREGIIAFIDTALPWETLMSPEINLSLLRPIVMEYRERNEKAIVWAFLANRIYFLEKAESDVRRASLQETRANVCQIIATRLLNEYHEFPELLLVLTYRFSQFQGEPHGAVLQLAGDDDELERSNALELALEADAKYFISYGLVQEILDQIWQGTIVFFASAIDHPNRTLPSTKPRLTLPTTPSNPKKTLTVYQAETYSFFRLSRLRVPKYKSFFQAFIFAIFLGIYTIVLKERREDIREWEVLMGAFALGLLLEKLPIFRGSSSASAYFQSIWNIFDLAILVIFAGFFGLRLRYLQNKEDSTLNWAFNILACNAILLWPRFFAVLDNYQFFGTMLIVIRHMMIDFTLFVALLIVFYIGFLQSFWALAREGGQSKWQPSTIAYLLMRVFFGSSYMGFDAAEDFSPIIGPIVMFLFVSISSLILMTILMSIFNQSFAKIAENAHEEFLFDVSRKIVSHIRSDNQYEYLPPFNTIQIFFVIPLRVILPTNLYWHLNRALLSILYMPMLIGIFIFERTRYRRQLSKNASSAKDPGSWLSNMRFPERGVSFIGHAIGVGGPKFRRVSFNFDGPSIFKRWDARSEHGDLAEALQAAFRGDPVRQSTSDSSSAPPPPPPPPPPPNFGQKPPLVHTSSMPTNKSVTAVIEATASATAPSSPSASNKVDPLAQSIKHPKTNEELDLNNPFHRIIAKKDMVLTAIPPNPGTNTNSTIVAPSYMTPSTSTPAPVPSSRTLKHKNHHFSCPECDRRNEEVANQVRDILERTDRVERLLREFVRADQAAGKASAGWEN